MADHTHSRPQPRPRPLRRRACAVRITRSRLNNGTSSSACSAGPGVRRRLAAVHRFGSRVRRRCWAPVLLAHGIPCCTPPPKEVWAVNLSSSTLAALVDIAAIAIGEYEMGLARLHLGDILSVQRLQRDRSQRAIAEPAAPPDVARFVENRAERSPARTGQRSACWCGENLPVDGRVVRAVPHGEPGFAHG